MTPRGRQTIRDIVDYAVTKALDAVARRDLTRIAYVTDVTDSRAQVRWEGEEEPGGKRWRNGTGQTLEAGDEVVMVHVEGSWVVGHKLS